MTTDSECPDCGAEGSRTDKTVVERDESLVFVEPYWTCTDDACAERWE